MLSSDWSLFIGYLLTVTGTRTLPQAFLVAFAFLPDTDKLYFARNSRKAKNMSDRGGGYFNSNYRALILSRMIHVLFSDSIVNRQYITKCSKTWRIQINGRKLMEDCGELLKKQGFIPLTSYCYASKVIRAFITRRFEQSVLLYWSFEYQPI
jgi:hypothetical protein